MTKFKFPHFFRPKKWQSPNFQAVSEYFRIISFGIPNSIRNLLLRESWGGLWFFSKNIFWFPMLLKKIIWFWWREKKKSDSEFLSYNLMLNSGKKIRAPRQKKIFYLLCRPKKIFWTKHKTITPPFKFSS
jgi:hypothetical protein